MLSLFWLIHVSCCKGILFFATGAFREWNLRLVTVMLIYHTDLVLLDSLRSHFNQQNISEITRTHQ